MLNKISEYKYQIYYGLLVAYLGLAYMALGSFSEWNPFGFEYQRLGHKIDSVFSLHPFAALVYLSYYFILVSPLLFFKDKKNIKELSINLILCSSVAHLCFILFPVVGPNRIPLDSSLLLYEILNNLYQFDTALNCFPSLHVAHSVLIGYYALNETKLAGSIKYSLMAFALFMGPSAVAVRQHYSADVIGAFALVLFSTWILSSRAYETAWEKLQKIPQKIRSDFWL